MTAPRLAAVLIALASSPPVFAAENPFAGTWKLNQEKSQLTGDTMSFTALRRGNIRFTGGGQTYTFKLDGKTYGGPIRQQVAWTQIGDRTWRAVWKVKKKPVYTQTLEVAADGKTLMDTVKGTKADGTPFEDSAVYERTAGEGISLMGTWRSTKLNVTGFQTINIEPRKNHGIVLTMVDFKSSCAAQLDGEDYSFKGPTTPPGLTFSFRPRGDRELRVIEKQNGSPIYSGAIKVDADGRTLTWDWKPVGVAEPMKAVFERQ